MPRSLSGLRNLAAGNNLYDPDEEQLPALFIRSHLKRNTSWQLSPVDTFFWEALRELHANPSAVSCAGMAGSCMRCRG